jgi:hypothetical protein
MKKLILIILISFYSCSSPIERTYNKESFENDLNELKKEINSEDFEILKNSIIMLSYDTESLEKMTYSEILQSGKDWENSINEEKYKKIQKEKFEKEKRKRYEKVIENLKILREAQIAYYHKNRNYTIDKTELSKFIKSDLNYFKVPYTEIEFELKIDNVEKIVGLKVPVFRIRIDKESVLKGLNKELIRKEKEVYSRYEINGEFISVGSLEEVTTGGNWPPSYDKTKYN